MTKAMTMGKIEGQGERAARLRHRRILRTVALLGIVGGITGVVMSLIEHPARHGGAPMPAWVAVAGVAVLVVGLIGGAILYFREVDEVELHANYWSANISIYFYMLAYPSWYMLWRAGVTPEPSHEALFASTFAVMAISYLWKKFRP